MDNQGHLQPYRAESLVVGNQTLRLPRRTAALLYVSDEHPDSVSSGLGIGITITFIDGQPEVRTLSPSEPSTIYLKMSVKKPTNEQGIPGPGYYPTYAGLSAEQKWIYLNWLRDVVKPPIDIGYLFVYYYGLERQLLIGEFDLAFEEIVLLRKHHKHPSFLAYSNAALLHSCILQKRRDRLEELYQTEELGILDNTGLMIAHHLGCDLSGDSLIHISPKIGGVNRRYMKIHSDLYSAKLSEVLQERYGAPYFPFAGRYRINELPRSQQLLFANISFPQDIRTPTLPDFFSYGPFVNEVKELLSNTHEEVKSKLKTRKRVK
jgi:hypothetical protein